MSFVVLLGAAVVNGVFIMASNFNEIGGSTGGLFCSVV